MCRSVGEGALAGQSELWGPKCRAGRHRHRRKRWPQLPPPRRDRATPSAHLGASDLRPMRASMHRIGSRPNLLSCNTETRSRKQRPEQ
jgi:hypothetical protein